METLASPADDALKVSVLVVEPLGSQNLLTVRIGDDIGSRFPPIRAFETHADAGRLAALPGRQDPLDRPGHQTGALSEMKACNYERRTEPGRAAKAILRLQ